MESLKSKFWFYQRSLSRQLLIGLAVPLVTVWLAALGVNYRLIQSDLTHQVKTRAQSITQSGGVLDMGIIGVNRTSKFIAIDKQSNYNVMQPFRLGEANSLAC
jgi:hypothetical protein